MSSPSVKPNFLQRIFGFNKAAKPASEVKSKSAGTDRAQKTYPPVQKQFDAGAARAFVAQIGIKSTTVGSETAKPSTEAKGPSTEFVTRAPNKVQSRLREAFISGDAATFLGLIGELETKEKAAVTKGWIASLNDYFSKNPERLKEFRNIGDGNFKDIYPMSINGKQSSGEPSIVLMRLKHSARTAEGVAQLGKEIATLASIREAGIPTLEALGCASIAEAGSFGKDDPFVFMPFVPRAAKLDVKTLAAEHFTRTQALIVNALIGRKTEDSEAGAVYRRTVDLNQQTALSTHSAKDPAVNEKISALLDALKAIQRSGKYIADLQLLFSGSGSAATAVAVNDPLAFVERSEVTTSDERHIMEQTGKWLANTIEFLQGLSGELWD